MKYLITLLGLLAGLDAKPQINYQQLKEKAGISCNKLTKESIEKTRAYLDSLAQFEVLEGKDMFYYDRGFIHYQSFSYTKDTASIKLAIDLHTHCWESYNNLSALWNLGQYYRIIGDCEKSLDLTECSGLAFLDRKLTTLNFLNHEKQTTQIQCSLQGKNSR